LSVSLDVQKRLRSPPAEPGDEPAPKFRLALVENLAVRFSEAAPLNAMRFVEVFTDVCSGHRRGRWRVDLRMRKLRKWKPHLLPT